MSEALRTIWISPRQLSMLLLNNWVHLGEHPLLVHLVNFGIPVSLRNMLGRPLSNNLRHFKNAAACFQVTLLALLKHIIGILFQQVVAVAIPPYDQGLHDEES